jgi:hypothetical protein
MTSKCEGSNARICAFVLLGNALLSSSFTGDKVPETDRNSRMHAPSAGCPGHFTQRDQLF